MAESITYPEGSYGIMPSDAFNKYLRYSNQRRAATGFGATPADKKAFWEGTMDSVIKNSAQRAAQALENKKYNLSMLNSDRSYELSKEQLENQNTASNRQAIGSLAQIPLTYMMYDALGLRRDATDPVTGEVIKPFYKRAGDWLGEQWNSLTGIPESASWQPDYVLPDSVSGFDSSYSGIPMSGYDPGDWWDFGSAVDLAIPEITYDFGSSLIDEGMTGAGTYETIGDIVSSVFDDWGSFGI